MEERPQTSNLVEEDARKEIRTETLFEGEREVIILHAGQRYRLRITRKDKLILQK